MKGKIIFIGIAVLLLVINASLNLYNIINWPLIVEEAPRGKAIEGYINFCVNAAPKFNLDNCPNTIKQNETFGCDINLSDTNGLDSTTITTTFGATTIFLVSDNGSINVDLDQGDIGNHTANISVDDGVGCSNSQVSTTYSFTVIDTNEFPDLISTVPDRSINEAENTSTYFLTNYFEDDDGDDMNFSVSGGSTIKSYYNTSNSETTFYGATCDTTESFTANATDGQGSIRSNTFQITVDCGAGNGSGTGGAGSGSSGGGGGGGGGPTQQEPTVIEGFIPTPLCKSHFWSTVDPDQELRLKVSEPLIPIQTVTLKTKHLVKNARLEVCVLQEAQQETTTEILEYIGIKGEGITEEDIEWMTIDYKVPTKWLKEKEIDGIKVRIASYDNGIWNIISSENVGESLDNIFYVARTKKFGAYKIDGISSKPIIQETEELNIKDETTEIRNEKTRIALEDKPSVLLSNPYSFSLVGQAIVIALVLALGVFLILRHRKPPKKPEHKEKPKKKEPKPPKPEKKLGDLDTY